MIRLARERAWVPALPAAVSWAFLFGYQWAFFLAYRGNQPTVFNYYSGVLGDGFLLPAVNVAGFVMMRELWTVVPWRRLPLYALLGMATAFGAFLMQAHLFWINWSMPAPFQWSAVGQLHFFVMAGEIAYLYLVLATAINNWKRLISSTIAWRAFATGWVGLVLFGATLAVDYIH